MPGSRRPLRLLAALAALLLLSAACSDDDDAATDDPTISDDREDGTASGDADADDADEEDAGEDTGDDADGDEGFGDVPDPCDHLTPADLQALFGSPFDAGTRTDNLETTGTLQCTWANTDAPPVKVISIAVASDEAQRAAFGRGAEELFELTRQVFEDSASIEEPDLGFGDESYRTGSTAYVLDGDLSYTFIVTGTSEEAIAGLKEMVGEVLDG
jgi:hypothetical protein